MRRTKEPTFEDSIESIERGEAQEEALREASASETHSLEEIHREGAERRIQALRASREFEERGSNEKAVKRDARRAKSMENFGGKLPSGQDTRDSRVVEEVWRQETRRFQADFPSWDGIKRSRVGKLIAKYEVVKTVRMFRYACRCWPQINNRMLKDQSPVPSLDFILKISDSLFTESSIWEKFECVRREVEDYQQLYPEASDLPEDLVSKIEGLGIGYQQLGLSF